MAEIVTFLILPECAPWLSKRKSVYYVGGSTLGVLFCFAFASWHLTPDDKLSWLLALALQCAAVGTAWYSLVPLDAVLAYGASASLGSLTLVHFYIGYAPIHPFMSDVVEASLALLGSAALFASPKYDRRTAALLFVVRAAVAALSRPRRPATLKELCSQDAFQSWIVQNHAAIRTRPLDVLEIEEEAG